MSLVVPSYLGSLFVAAYILLGWVGEKIIDETLNGSKATILKEPFILP